MKTKWYNKNITTVKESLLLLLSITLTIIITMTGILWFAPQLLGIPMDLQLVKTAKVLPPFFDGIFRYEDYSFNGFIIEDPILKRAKPLFPGLTTAGPHDIMGFRNRQIPNSPDIITIGDSQTYGNNAVIDRNWPSYMLSSLGDRQSVTYNMSVGGWAAPQYLEIFYKATFLRPRLVILAFYTGNDPQESFIHVYGNDRWADLRTNSDISANDIVKSSFPVPESEMLPVQFNDGIKTIFTPRHRYVSNMDHPSVKAGYEIMAKVAKQISIDAEKAKIKLVFTIIPSKELAFAKKVKEEKLETSQEYLDLVREENKNLNLLADKLRKLSGAEYIDVLAPLQNAALSSKPLYPDNQNGHPISAGYKLIGTTIAENIKGMLPPEAKGVFQISSGQKPGPVYLMHDKHIWRFTSEETFFDNGWQLDDISQLEARDIAGIPHGGLIETIAPELFGPLGNL